MASPANLKRCAVIKAPLAPPPTMAIEHASAFLDCATDASIERRFLSSSEMV